MLIAIRNRKLKDYSLGQIWGKSQTKIRFNIDKAEKMSSVDEDKIISGYDLQNNGKRIQFLSKVHGKKGNELLGTNVDGF